MKKFQQYLLEINNNNNNIENMNREKFLIWIKNNFIKNKTFDLETQLLIIKKGIKIFHFFNIIKYIKNPQKKVQLISVTEYGYSIEYIKNPDEKIQLAAVKEDGRSICYIKNPNKKVELAAVKNIGISIKCIKNPDYNVQLAAVKQDGKSIKFIINKFPKIFIHDDIKIAAIKQNKKAIDFIKGLNNESILNILKFDKNLIQKIKNKNGLRRFSKLTQEYLINKMPNLLSQYPNKFTPLIKKKYQYLITPGKLGILDNND